MKTILALSLGLLMTAGTITAYAAAPSNAGVRSTPYTAYAAGSEQMPAFTYSAPAGEPADPVVIATPFTSHATGSEQMPAFDYQRGVVVSPTIGVDQAINRTAPSDATISITQNGGR